jgi:hypothetical protein
MRYYLIFFFLSTAAHAGVYLEPAVGYEHGKISETYVNSGVVTNKPSSSGGGLTVGAKLGYHVALFFMGAEYERASLGIAEPKDWSAFAGVSVPLVKVWGSYIFSAQTGIGKGTGYKLGVGTSFLLFLGLNGEYSVRNYKTYHGPALASGTTYSGDLKTFKATLSLPLGF